MADSKYVVIVEPSDIMRTLLECVVVSRLGWKAGVADTGPQAWELIQKQKPDLVIAEGCLEGYENELGGLELCRQIRVDPKLSHIPVVLTSVSSREARQAGSAASLLKPFSLHDLLRTIDRVLHERHRPGTNGRPSQEEHASKFETVRGRPPNQTSNPSPT
jgi:CheY-like chemotaxis protein